MEKIIICLVVMLMITGCNNQEDKTKKISENDVPMKVVTSGVMPTINSDGFKINLVNEDGFGVLTIKNVSSKPDQSYVIKFMVYQSNGTVSQSENKIAANFDGMVKSYTNLKIDDITKVEYEIEEVETIKMGS